MATESIDELMLVLLNKYQHLIVNRLEEDILVGEYLTDSRVANARLLCQMRTIIFLCKTASFLTQQHIDLAEKLYLNSEIHYFKEDKWLQQLNSSEEATLYSYAFVILAQSYLYKVTNNPLYSIALAESFSVIDSNFQGRRAFKPLSELACLEQNSAMHLYEALTFAFYQANATYMADAISTLQREIKNTFWQQDKYLLAEKVDFSGNVLTYEAGHWFEWVSLLWRVKQWGGNTFIHPADFYQSAVLHTRFTEQCLVLNEMDKDLVPQHIDQIRIWSHLEYLRAKALMGQLTEQDMGAFIQLFFDEQGLPIEYIGSNLPAVKSTTGYHIAESFIDILAIS